MSIIYYLCQKYLFMFKLDFSDIKRNGYRINQFRLFHSPEMRDPKFDYKWEELKTSDDLIGQRLLMVKYLLERNEIYYTLHFFSARILVILIFIAVYTILFYNGGLILKLLPIISASVFYILSIRYKESFVMCNVGLQITESLYDSKIAARYNV